MKPTIRDVAERAGVSVATVSRYLNKSALIAEPSIEKVEAAIKELNFKPNMMARGLAKRSTHTVAMVVNYSEETYSNEFFLKIQLGIERELARQGYYLMVVDISNPARVGERLEEIILEERVDGIILLNEMASGQVIDLLKRSRMPFVIAGRSEIEDVPWVDINNIMAGYLAANRLIACGARDIGFITNDFQKKFVAERFQGYQKALAEHGLTYRQEAVKEQLSGYQEQVCYLVEHIDKLCDAYVVSDSMIAYYFLKALQALRISVPGDVQVIAFDNQIVAEISEPGMTVVDIDVTELGVNAAKIVLKILAADSKASTAHELLDVRIIERNSTAL